MRRTILLLALGLFPAAWAGPVEEAYRGADRHLLAQVRNGFETAPESPTETRRLIALLDGSLPEDRTDWPPVFQAYRAALEGLAGKHSPSPWGKYSRAKAGLAQFHGLAEGHPESMEIRMLRFSFCSQLPDFFGMGPQAEADLAALADLFEQRSDPMVDEAYRRGAIRWILRNAAPPPPARARFEALLDGPE